jgi:dimethylhistidine N-methyltransferase
MPHPPHLPDVSPAQASAAVRDEIVAGLAAPEASVSPKYFYDALGSRLFEAICELPEYYPTRTEAAIFERDGADMAQHIGSSMTLIDLGAGNCAKAARLFPLLHPAQYVAIDISYDFLRESLDRLQLYFPHIEMTGLGLDFSSRLDLPGTVRGEQRLFFYPGSSIGNFDPQQALAFLHRLRDNCGADGGLLIGVDLIKDAATLDAAYDDALGVTAAFNLNLLRHLNRLIGADFNVRKWRHRGYFNHAKSRIEMHLEAREALTVTWPEGERRFARGEGICTEHSYKYTREGFADLLEEGGFGVTHSWTDPAQWFAVVHARALGA